MKPPLFILEPQDLREFYSDYLDNHKSISYLAYLEAIACSVYRRLFYLACFTLGLITGIPVALWFLP
ncbi:MAG: hypothetical protein Q8K65_06205 [Alphaproteobacteria bacterium]|nr:hypothetical protein [Alphaproteobacteria bacterium]